jgi:hypothetical protein
LSKPKKNSFTVYVFGGGVGESIVIHKPDNKFLVIDSFKNNETKRSIVLDFLEYVGADPKVDVSQIIISHWHDDHISGISKVIETCDSAEVFCSSALLHKDFLELVNLQEKHKSMLSQESGVDEFIAIKKILSSRLAAGASKHICYAGPDRIIFRDLSLNLEISTLSPSDKEIDLAISGFAKIISEIKPLGPKKTIPSTHEDPNDTAIAIAVKYNEHTIVLGSDLEQRIDPETGWSKAIQCTTFPKGTLSLIKVAHHGSQNGHNDNIWSKQVCENSLAVLTPFNRSHLPRITDKERILSHTKKAYLSADKTNSKPEKRDRAVEKLLSESGVKRKVNTTKAGCVEIYFETGHEPTFNLSGSAVPLTEFIPLK